MRIGTSECLTSATTNEIRCIPLIYICLNRFRDILNYFVAKADAERQGRDLSDLVTFNVTAEQLNGVVHLVVEIVDGYHRYGALMLLLNSPYELVERNMDVDWEAVALRYPDWVKLDRYFLFSRYYSTTKA